MRFFWRQTPNQTPQDQVQEQTESVSSTPSESSKSTPDSNEKSQDTTLSSEEAIITNDKVEKVGTCFKHFLEECNKDGTAKELGLCSMPFLTDAVDMATSVAKRPSVQDAILSETKTDPDFMKKVEEEIDSLNLVDNEDEGGSKEEQEKESKYKQTLDCLRRMSISVRRRVKSTMKWAIEEIMVCFKVGKEVALKILDAMKACFLWVVKAIMDPKGEIKRVLDDPEKPSKEKVLEIVGLFASAILCIVISQNAFFTARYVGPTLGSAIGTFLIAIQSDKSKQTVSAAKSIYNFLQKNR